MSVLAQSCRTDAEANAVCAVISCTRTSREHGLFFLS